MDRLRLAAAGTPETPAWHLSVDGMSPTGPNLSHWPGNRTPPRWKADLSTGICLAFARAAATDQDAFLAGATAVLNDHYDTDGFLSLLAVLRPDVALPRTDAILAAAGTGDFQTFHGRRAFAVDRIVANLAAPGGPAAAACAGLAGGARDFVRYRWLLDHAEAVLDDPEQFEGLFADELATVERQLADASITCETDRALGLACVRSRGPVHRMVLNTKAGGCYRVLHIQDAGGRCRVRFHERTESWFELATFAPPPRRDLAALRDELSARETTIAAAGTTTAGTATAGTVTAGTRGDVRTAHTAAAAWCLDPPTEPVPELYFGDPAPQAYGQINRTLAPSGLPAAEIERRFAAFFAGDPAPAAGSG